MKQSASGPPGCASAVGHATVHVTFNPAPAAHVRKIAGDLQIVADLTPRPLEFDEGPARTRYWVRNITEKHEKFHETEHLRPMIEERFIPSVLALLQEDRWCTDGCRSMPGGPDVEAEIQRLWDEHVHEPWEAERRDREVLAYNQDHIQYCDLITEIQGRARREGWNTCQSGMPPECNP